jgi:ribosome-associated protein
MLHETLSAGSFGSMTTPSRPRRKPRRNSTLEKLVVAALEEMKAVNVKVLDVRGLTDFTDAMVVASGNSDRHVRAIAQHVVERARSSRQRSLGVEGARDGEWVLVDLQDVVVHVMLPRVRETYAIEQLWEAPAKPRRLRTAAR